jgi:hypothetical protein
MDPYPSSIVFHQVLTINRDFFLFYITTCLVTGFQNILCPYLIRAFSSIFYNLGLVPYFYRNLMRKLNFLIPLEGLHLKASTYVGQESAQSVAYILVSPGI